MARLKNTDDIISYLIGMKYIKSEGFRVLVQKIGKKFMVRSLPITYKKTVKIKADVS
jgi:hypothetical protein